MTRTQALRPTQGASVTESMRCAIIDDHEVVRAGTRAQLEPLDWIDIVGEAGSIAAGTELVRSTTPDIALVDVRLPDGDGLELARTIAACSPATRVVLYSGTATVSQAEQALDAGVSGFVLKGSPLSQMIDALRAARDGRRYIDPTIAAELMSPSGTRPLSPRELQILRCMADGGQNGVIAFDLGISIETVKAHVSNILVKLDADSRTHAVAAALRSGIIE